MIKINKQTLCTPLKHDNCKECIALCEHAGKDREFCYRGESCKKVDDKFKTIKTNTLKEFVNKLKIECDKTEGYRYSYGNIERVIDELLKEYVK